MISSKTAPTTITFFDEDFDDALEVSLKYYKDFDIKYDIGKKCYTATKKDGSVTLKSWDKETWMNAKDFDKLDKNKNFDISSIHQSKLSRQDSRQGMLDEGETRSHRLSYINHIVYIFHPLVNIINMWIGMWIGAKNQETIEKYAGYQFDFGIRCTAEILDIYLSLSIAYNQICDLNKKYGHISGSKKRRYKKLFDQEIAQLEKDLQILKNVDDRRKKMGLPSIKSTLKYMVRDIMANPDSLEYRKLNGILIQYRMTPSSGTYVGPTDCMKVIDDAINVNDITKLIKDVKSLYNNYLK